MIKLKRLRDWVDVKKERVTNQERSLASDLERRWRSREICGSYTHSCGSTDWQLKGLFRVGIHRHPFQEGGVKMCAIFTRCHHVAASLQEVRLLSAYYVFAKALGPTVEKKSIVSRRESLIIGLGGRIDVLQGDACNIDELYLP